MISFDVALLQSIVDRSDAAIYAKDKNLTFIYVNPVVADLYGSDVGAMIGKKDIDFLAEEEAKKFNEVDHRVIASGKSEIVHGTIEILGKEYIFEDHKFQINLKECMGIAGISFLKPSQT